MTEAQQFTSSLVRKLRQNQESLEGREAKIQTKTKPIRIDARFLECRDYSHAWVTSDVWAVKDTQILRRKVTCARCGTTRTEDVDRSGDIITRQYNYPTGYQTTGVGPVRRHVYRAAHLAAIQG